MAQSKLTRAQALKAIEAAGIAGDQASRLRIYTEYRISLSAANEAWSRGVAARKRFDARAIAG